MQLEIPLVSHTYQDQAAKSFKTESPDVGLTSGQKPSTKIICIVLQTSVGLS